MKTIQLTMANIAQKGLLLKEKTRTTFARFRRDELGAPQLGVMIGLAIVGVLIVVALYAIFSDGFTTEGNKIFTKLDSLN